jgi:hypothetical protein
MDFLACTLSTYHGSTFRVQESSRMQQSNLILTCVPFFMLQSKLLLIISRSTAFQFRAEGHARGKGQCYYMHLKLSLHLFLLSQTEHLILVLCDKRGCASFVVGHDSKQDLWTQSSLPALVEVWRQRMGLIESVCVCLQHTSTGTLWQKYSLLSRTQCVEKLHTQSVGDTMIASQAGSMHVILNVS